MQAIKTVTGKQRDYACKCHVALVTKNSLGPKFRWFNRTPRTPLPLATGLYMHTAQFLREQAETKEVKKVRRETKVLFAPETLGHLVLTHCTLS